MPYGFFLLFFRFLLIVEGLLLLAAGALKTWLLVTDPFADLRTGYPKTILVLAVIVEIAVAAWFLFGRDRAIQWIAMTSLFSLFLVISVARWALGISGCGCLGAVELPRWVLPANSGFVLVASFLIAKGWNGRRLLDFSGVRNLAHRFYTNPDWAAWLTTAMTVVGLFVAWPWLQTVPLFARLAGEPELPAIHFSASHLVVGEKSEIRIPWRNPSSFSVEILGSETSCTCIGLADARQVVGPSEETCLTAIVRPKKTGFFHQRIVCFVNHPRQDRLFVDVVGTAVLPEPQGE